MYHDLTKIAPTIMSEGDDWKLTLRLHGEALGRTNDSEELLIDWDNRVAKVKREIGDRKIAVRLPRRKGARGRVGESRSSPTSASTAGAADRRSSGVDAGPEWSARRAARGPRRCSRTSRTPSRQFSPPPLGAPPFGRWRRGRCPRSSSTPCPASPRAASAALPMPRRPYSTCWRAPLPGGSLVLGQVDWDEGLCRVIDARGDGVPRGTEIPLAKGVPANGAAAGELLDAEALAALGPANWVAAPLDAADGSVVGVLLATGPDGQSPSREVAQLILVGARLLSYEWESISARAELRRLAEVARDRASTDPVTGLPNRETLLGSSSASTS